MCDGGAKVREGYGGGAEVREGYGGGAEEI